MSEYVFSLTLEGQNLRSSILSLYPLEAVVISKNLGKLHSKKPF